MDTRFLCDKYHTPAVPRIALRQLDADANGHQLGEPPDGRVRRETVAPFKLRLAERQARPEHAPSRVVDRHALDRHDHVVDTERLENFGSDPAVREQGAGKTGVGDYGPARGCHAPFSAVAHAVRPERTPLDPKLDR